MLPWVLALTPLLIAPRLSFYYDVIPRLSLILFTAAAMLTMRRDVISGVRVLAASSPGRWFCVFAGLHAVSLIVSAAVSSRVWLSINGSTWRRFGLITQLALMVIAVILAADLKRRPEGLRQLLRAFTACGLAASIYGVFQYFGKDPFIDSSGYHVGEGVWMIVRPPGTLGHASYFGVYLLMVVFPGWAVAVSDTDRTWRRIAAVAMVLASFAILLTGTRAAVAGGIAGAGVVAWCARPPVRQRHALVALLIAGGLGAFYLSPAGERLRARVRWSIEDAHGGARAWLWRDSLRMAGQRPILGYGPETFHVEFPRFQSIALARAYPEFQHESPHNIAIDAFTAQGVPGVIALAGLLLTGVAGALLAPAEKSRIAAVLLGCLVALVTSQQFCSPTVATAVCLLVTIACLVSLDQARITVARGVSLPWRFASVALACVFAGYGVRLSAADWYLARSRDRVAATKIPAATDQYAKAAWWLPRGASADLYYSRSMAAAASRTAGPAGAVQAWQQAVLAGTRAIDTSDEPANAAYHLAALHAAANNVAGTEASLREAIARAPAWFKPYWMLARVLSLAGRFQEAETAAAAAAERNGGKNAEVLQTLQEIRQAVASGRR